jgi:hypothetical protein
MDINSGSFLPPFGQETIQYTGAVGGGHRSAAKTGMDRDFFLKGMGKWINTLAGKKRMVLLLIKHCLEKIRFSAMAVNLGMCFHQSPPKKEKGANRAYEIWQVTPSLSFAPSVAESRKASLA